MQMLVWVFASRCKMQKMPRTGSASRCKMQKMPMIGSASRCKMQKIKLIGNRAPRVVKSLEYREKKAKVLVDHIIIFFSTNLSIF